MDPGLAEICRSVRIAREYAVLGRYQPALTFMQGLVEQCDTQMRIGGDVAVLRQIRDDLTKELDLIQQITAELKSFAGVGGPAGGARHVHSADEGVTPPQRWDDLPVRGNAGGQHNYVVAPGEPQPAPAVPGERNKLLFGDPDKFGHGFDAAAAPPRPRWRETPAPSKVEQERPPRRVPSNLGKGPAAAPVRARERVMRKEPLPPAARPRSPRAGARGQGEEKPRYQARKGEEEMSEMIHNEITDLKRGINWDDIAGNLEAKKLLEEAVIYPILMPDFFSGIRRAWRGVLMYGPPGTGKTLLAKAVATECGTTFFNVSVATLTSKWRGESEKLVRVLFEMARFYAPSTIFIDEIDSLCSKRGAEGEHEASRRVKTELLVQMDGMSSAADTGDGDEGNKVVMVLGATNHPWEIDEAMRRRLEKRIYIPCPDMEDRVELFKINTKTMETTCTEDDWQLLARKTEGYSGADITNVCRDAGMSSLRRMLAEKNRSEIRANAKEIQEDMKNAPIDFADFEQAIRNTPSSVNQDTIRKFTVWMQEFGAAV